MISAISGSAPVGASQMAAQSQAAAAKANSASPQSHQDTVSLSSAAQQAMKASVDVDHDGDSH